MRGSVWWNVSVEKNWITLKCEIPHRTQKEWGRNEQNAVYGVRWRQTDACNSLQVGEVFPGRMWRCWSWCMKWLLFLLMHWRKWWSSTHTLACQLRIKPGIHLRRGRPRTRWGSLGVPCCTVMRIESKQKMWMCWSEGWHAYSWLGMLKIDNFYNFVPYRL